MYVNRLPFKHLIKEFAKSLQKINGEEAPLNNTLHEASQAYLAGIFDGYSNVCQNVAKKESTDFLLCLASLGLKKLVSTIVTDKEVCDKVKRSRHHFHRNSEMNPNYLDGSHDHGHHEHHGHQHEGHQAPRQQNNNVGQTQHINTVIQNIMRRISSNVTISVLRE